MLAKFAIGIDLGTTNSVLAYAPLDAEQPMVEVLPLPQLVAAGSVESRSTLPSFLYLGTDEEAKAGSFALPWSKKPNSAVGEFARTQAAQVPMRTVAAAKSWLAHSRVDRREPILPWNAPADVPKVSPVTASQRYLEHMVSAWKAAFPDALLAEQEVVLTVPASFDAVARELTREAAIAAGLPESMVLLEEPQAALYAWLGDAGEYWRRRLKVGDTLLVCDVGGGTTDLTVIDVDEADGQLELRRRAVGNHVLVGGDNMDLALAHHVAEAFAAKGTELDAWQSVALWHSCRNAKEQLLAPSGPKKQPIAVLGRGSKLIKGTISVDLEREAAAELLLEGFFPACDVTEKPNRGRASGFRELGLQFEAETGITRHLAAFLSAHGEGGAVRPTHVLFNGGVFKATAFRERLLQTLGGWFPSQPAPQPLEANDDLDQAVARGAAFYGFAKQRGGVRIRGGTARSYYLGIESAGLAIPGRARPLRGLCVVPMGMEEGTETAVPSPEIGLVVGERSHFRFFSSSTRKHDQPGTFVDRWTDEELDETAPLEATLPTSTQAEEGYVPVHFRSKITELGIFELWCESTISPEQWKLEFNVRHDDT